MFEYFYLCIGVTVDFDFLHLPELCTGLVTYTCILSVFFFQSTSSDTSPLADIPKDTPKQIRHLINKGLCEGSASMLLKHPAFVSK